MKKILALFLLAFTLFGCAKPQTQTLIPTNVEVIKHDFTDRELVTGTIKNPSSKKISFLQVRFNFYDRDGKVIGTARAYLNSLNPQETWTFTAGLQGTEFKDVYEFECVEATGILE